MSGIIVVTKAAKASIIKHEAQAALSLRMLHSHAMTTIKSSITATQHNMQIAANGNDGAVPQSFLYSVDKFHVIAQIKTSISHFGQQTKQVLADVTRVGSQSGAQMAQAQLHASVPRGYTYSFAQAHPSPKQVARTAKLYQTIDRYGEEAATAAVDAIRQGVIAGRGPINIARDLMDACDMSLVSALTTSRTESMRSLRDATLANYQANSDVVDGWIWYASLGRACAMCTAMHGTEHGLDEDMDSHNNCECTQVPKTKSWADIFAGTGIDTSDIPDSTLDVPSGADWFANQSGAQQRDILGPAKYNAYQAGDISLDDLVGKSHSDTWGGSRYEKSMKDLGLNASDYADD